MEFSQEGCDRSRWLGNGGKSLKQIHIVDTMPDFHYDTGLKSMYMDVVKPTEDQRLHRSSKTGLLLRDNETITGPCTLSTEGIAGAQVPPLYKFTNRGAHAFSNLPKTWDDLPRSTPKVLIPEHVNRPSQILESKDITGAPEPKNMILGDRARNTNPMDPHYILPSYVEPFIPLPKFVKNSLDVADIEGTRPSSRQRKGVPRSEERGSLRVIDIEGTQPGWKPLYRRHIGKSIRNLSLTAEDINGPKEERVVRPLTSEVYHDIDGSHSKDLSWERRPGTPHTLSLRIDDIEGAYAGSGSWEGTTRRKKEFAKCHSRDLIDQKDAQDTAVNILTTRVQDQLKRKGLLPRDVVTTFHQLDRQNSGKLDISEVSRAFKTLRLDVDQADLTSISKAFVHPTGDGYLDYWKLVSHLVPVLPQRRGLHRDASDSVAKSLDQSIKSSPCHKPCYDPAWVADVVASRECRLSDGESGTQFRPFHSGRPVTYSPSKYLKHPPFKDAFTPEVHQQPLIQTVNYTTPIRTQPGEEPNGAAADNRPKTQTSTSRTQSVTTEVPLLSVLPGSIRQPALPIKDTSFLETTRSKPREVRGRDETLFSELKGSDFSPGEISSTSVPMFYRLKGMNSYETKPLPIGGPFWPGFVDPQPEDIAPRRQRTPSRNGPLPMGEAFWSGVERPQSAPRISLRRDYPVPPLFSDVHSDINLRKTGPKERITRTWLDTIGQGASAITYAGEGDQVLPRPGIQGSIFSRPSSAIRPQSDGHQNNWKRGDQLESRAQTRTSCPSNDWTPEAVPRERVRPQTVNSVARGSPSENLLSSNCERKLVSAMKRPSTTQSVTSTVRSGVTFSPMPTRPCTPYDIISPDISPPVVRTDQTLSTRIRNQSQLGSHGSNRGKTKSTQRRQAQLWEDMRSVRLLV